MNFYYRGRDARGMTVSGTVQAGSRDLAVRELRQRGIFVTSCREMDDTQAYGWKNFLRRTVSRRDLALFSRQLATMLEAGLPIINALKILEQQMENQALKDSIILLRQDLEAGTAFYESLARQPGIYPSIFVHTIEAGELSGALDETLRRLAEHLEREHEVEEKIKTALTYPAVITVVTVIVVIFLLTYILPTFQTLLSSMQVPLPWPTLVVMETSSLLQRFWPVIILFFTLLIYIFYRWHKTPEGRYKVSRMCLKLPVFGSLHHKAVLSRFSRTLGTLLSSGVSILPALEVTRRTAGNAVFSEAIARVEESIRDGHSLAGPLGESGIFPPMMVEMINVGEETGALDKLLEKISDFYDREVRDTVDRLTSLVEPMLIIILGCLIGLVIISVLLPVFTMVGGVQ